MTQGYRSHTRRAGRGIAGGCFDGGVGPTDVLPACAARVGGVDPAPEEAAPSFTWLLLYQDPKDKAQAKVIVEFMKWALQDGQKFAPEMGYAPLPKAVVDLELKSLATIKTQ